MRIAFLCKRQYTNKDVIFDRFGRLYEIPLQLARLGHEVRAYCVSYQGHSSGRWVHEVSGDGALEWSSTSLNGPRVLNMPRYPWQLLTSLGAWHPQVLIGASDIPHAALTRWLADRLQVPYALDIYDNFAGYGQARIPGFMPALRWAIKKASLVVAVSQPLRDLIVKHYDTTGSVVVIPNCAETALFRPQDKAQCRQSLGLPLHAKLVGTAGGLEAVRGVDVLYRAWETLSRQEPDLHLVLAGTVDPNCPPPVGERVHYLGQLPHVRTAQLFGALDVGVVYLRDTAFGRLCFPQKAVEMQACNLPYVAANIGVMGELLGEVPGNLYEAGSADDLVRAVRRQLLGPTRANFLANDWAQVVADLEHKLISSMGAPAA